MLYSPYFLHVIKSIFVLIISVAWISYETQCRANRGNKDQSIPLSPSNFIETVKSINMARVLLGRDTNLF